MIREVNTHNIFVLRDDENRVVAAIEISLDIEKTKEKICLAIAEDTNFENVIITDDFEIEEYCYSLEFDVEFEDEGEKGLRTWYLEKSALY